MKIQCPVCDKRGNVQDSLDGRKVICKTCGISFLATSVVDPSQPHMPASAQFLHNSGATGSPLPHPPTNPSEPDAQAGTAWYSRIESASARLRAKLHHDVVTPLIDRLQRRRRRRPVESPPQNDLIPHSESDIIAIKISKRTVYITCGVGALVLLAFQIGRSTMSKQQAPEAGGVFGAQQTPTPNTAITDDPDITSGKLFINMMIQEGLRQKEADDQASKNPAMQELLRPQLCGHCGGSGDYRYVDGHGNLIARTCPTCQGRGRR